jgi:membrane-bound lytic murein transglycosylase D
MSLEKLADLTDICLTDLESLNPSVKNRKIPESNRSMAVNIPKSKALFIKENLAWISDSLNQSSSTPLLASSTPVNVVPVESLVQEIRQNGTTYKVRSGDVLGSIAIKHGVTVTQLKSWNNLSSNLIKVGQILKINSSSGNTLAENQSKSSSPRTYIVQPGDSLWVISKKHNGITIEDIKRLNNLNTNNIKPGQKLIIG